MRRIAVVALVASFLASLGLASSARGIDTTCPDGFTHTTALESPSTDRNENGVICKKQADDRRIFAYVDDQFDASAP